MKIVSSRSIVLALAIGVVSFVIPNKASAAVNIGIQVGSPPPPPLVEHPWARPYRTAVWIPGHQEWIRGRWVWVGGYYDYPPYRGARWIPGHYRRGYWRPGHWAR